MRRGEIIFNETFLIRRSNIDEETIVTIPMRLLKPEERLEFEFTLSTNSDLRRRLVYSVELKTHVYQNLSVSGSLSFRSPEWVSSFYFGGTLSRTNPKISEGTDIPLSKIEALVDKFHYIELIIDMRVTRKILPSITCVCDVKALLLKLLQKHDMHKTVTLDSSEVDFVLASAGTLFLKQPSLLYINGPVVVVGDIHGEFIDLLNIFVQFGSPATTKYLFLGDIVDRGDDSVDTVLLLCMLKILYPTNLYIIRGNRDTFCITAECREKGLKFDSFYDVFWTLPFAAVISNRIFCVHGGISMQYPKLDDIKQIHRPVQLTAGSGISELVENDFTREISDYGNHSEHQLQCLVGPTAVKKFLDVNGLSLIIRGHKHVKTGFEFTLDNVITVVSSRISGAVSTPAVIFVEKDTSYSVAMIENPQNRKDFLERDFAFLVE